jgi:hypothetical protein
LQKFCKSFAILLACRVMRNEGVKNEDTRNVRVQARQRDGIANRMMTNDCAIKVEVVATKNLEISRGRGEGANGILLYTRSLLVLMM